MELFDLALVLENVLSKDECASLIQEYETKKILAGYEKSTNAVTGKVEQSSAKIVKVPHTSKNYNLIKDKTEFVLSEWIKNLDKYGMFNTFLLKGILKYPHSFRLLKYENGLSIHPHSDWGYFTHASVTLNLNSGYEGGEFVFFNGKKVLKLKEGDAVVFPADSFWVHSVNPVTKGARYSMNTFIDSLPFEETPDFLSNIEKCQYNSPRIYNFAETKK